MVVHPQKTSLATDAEAAGVPEDRVTSTVAFSDGDRFSLAVVPATERIDVDKARGALAGSASLRFADDAVIERHIASLDSASSRR